MSKPTPIEGDSFSPAELLATSEALMTSGANDWTMYRAAVLEAITALETSVQTIILPGLRRRLGSELAKWIEEKTRMDFDSRLGLLVPVVTTLKVDKSAKLWIDYKSAKKIRNSVTHSGKKVSQEQARTVINTVYEWLEYLSQAREVDTSEATGTQAHALGRLVQASARLERVIYEARRLHAPDEPMARGRLAANELERYSLIDRETLREVLALQALRNQAVHAPPTEPANISKRQIDRLNAIVDEIEAKLASAHTSSRG